MSRAAGRRNRTGREPAPNTPEGDEIGLSARQSPEGSPIPGGQIHVTNHPTVRQQVPVPESRPEYRGVMAHGVPAQSHTGRERADQERGPNDHRPLERAYEPPKLPEHPVAIPVYLTQGPSSGPQPLAPATTKLIQVPAAGGEPARLGGVDPRRHRMLLLNEDTAIVVRIADSIAQLTAPAGQIPAAALPAVTNSYLPIYTKGELWAIADGTAAVYVSVINEVEQPGAAP